MGTYSGNGSVYKLLNVRITQNSNSELLSNFDKDSENKSLNSFLFFDKDLNVSKFFVKELDIDIKDCLKPEHIEYYRGLYKSGEGLVVEDLLVEYEVSGWYTPARMSGVPEYSSPEEGEEDRVVTSCFVQISDVDILFPESCFNSIYNIFEKDINRDDFTDSGSDYYE